MKKYSYIQKILHDVILGRNFINKSIYELEGQICPTYEGKPLGIQKCFLIIGIICIGAGLSVIWLL